MLLGNSEVGKTSLFNRVISGNYFEEGVTTSAAYFRSKIVQIDEKTELKINLWDTAGQEKFHSLTQMYLQDAAGVLLVYDLTQTKSFEDVLLWHKMIADSLDMSRTVVILLGNKSDNDEMCAVAPQAAAQRAASIGAKGCLEVSAKENINIDTMLQKLAKELIIANQSSDASRLQLVSKQKKKSKCC